MTTPAQDVLDGPDSSRTAAHGTAWRLASYGVSLLVSVVSIRLLTTHLDNGFGLMIAMLQGAMVVHLQLDLRFAAVAALDLVKSITLATAYGALVLAGSGLTGFYFAPVAAGTAILLATAPLVPRTLLRPRFDRPAWKRMVRAVLPYSLAAAIAILYFRVTQIAMSYTATSEETTQYAFAFRIVEVLSVIPGLVASSALPLLSRASVSGHERFRLFVTSLSSTAVLAGMSLATATGAAAPLAIRVIGGDGASTSVDVLRLLAMAIAFTFPLTIWSFLLISVERYSALALGGALAALSALVLAIILVPTFGAIGGALATVGGEVVLASVLFRTIARFDRALIPPPGRFVRPLAALGAPVAIIAATRHDGMVLPLLAMPAFAIAALSFRAVPPELFDIVRRRRT